MKRTLIPLTHNYPSTLAALCVCVYVCFVRACMYAYAIIVHSSKVDWVAGRGGINVGFITCAGETMMDYSTTNISTL